MKRRRNRVPCERNNRWYERYQQGGYFCLPRALLFNIVDYIDNATLYVYMALASCHFENNSTYAGPHVAKLTGKDERNVRDHLADLETLGLIEREPLGRGFKVLFQCPTRARIKEGADRITEKKAALLHRRKKSKEQAPTAEAVTLEANSAIEDDEVAV
jgi:hypothetical protein